MTPTDFAAALARTSLRSPQCIDGARLMLLEGLSSAEAGRRVGRSRGEVHRAMQRVERAYLDAQGMPAHWRVVTEVVPPDAIAELREVAESARRADKRKNG